jgi:hypothetical protein
LAKDPAFWEKIKAEFETSESSFADLAKKHGISAMAICKHSKLHKWIRYEDLKPHIEEKVAAIQKVKDLDRKELGFNIGKDARKRIECEVQTKLSLIEQYSRINQKITNRLLGYLDHDSRILQDPDKPIDLHELGKLKMASEILKNTRQTSIGDAPLMEMTEAELADKEDDLQFAIVIPAAEKLRVDAIRARK